MVCAGMAGGREGAVQAGLCSGPGNYPASNPLSPRPRPIPHAGEEQAFLFVRRVISLGLCALHQRATLAEAAGKRNIRTQAKTSFAFYWGGFAWKGEGSRQSPSFRPAVLGLVLKHSPEI